MEECIRNEARRAVRQTSAQAVGLRNQSRRSPGRRRRGETSEPIERFLFHTYVHAVISTKDRQNPIPLEFEEPLYSMHEANAKMR
jgi:hypothetical protein